jgi:uncharacterized protein
MKSYSYIFLHLYFYNILYMLRTYLKYLHPAQQLVILLGICFLIASVGMLISGLIIQSQMHVDPSILSDIANGKIKNPEQYKPYLMLNQVLSVLLIFIIPAYLFAYFADPQPAVFLNTYQLPKAEFVSKTVILVILGMLATILLGVINSEIVLPKKLMDSEKASNKLVELLAVPKDKAEIWVSILVVGFFAAVSEELLFRGVLQRILIQWTKNHWIGIVITAFIFSAVHMQFSGFLPRMGLGIILGILYWYSQNLFIPILYHFLHNSIGVAIASYKPKSVNSVEHLGKADMLPIIIVGILATIGIVYIFKKMHNKSKVAYTDIYEAKPDFF